MQGDSIGALASGAAATVASLTPPASARARQGDDPATVARDFEALLVQNLLRTMRESGMGEMSNEESVYYDLFDDKIAAEIADSGRLGLADQIARGLPGGDKTVSRDKTVPHVDTVSHTVNNPDRLVFVEQLWRSRMNPSTNAVKTASQAVDTGNPGDVPADPRQRFLDDIGPLARSEGARAGIDPLPIMAIAALETGWGQRMIDTADGRNANNYFGIKQHAQAVPAVSHATTEYDGGRKMTVQANFRQYDSMSASVRGFVDFLKDNPRYRQALETGTDPEAFVRALHDAGYATDPAYPVKLIDLMDQIRRMGEA